MLTSAKKVFGALMCLLITISIGFTIIWISMPEKSEKAKTRPTLSIITWETTKKPASKSESTTSMKYTTTAPILLLTITTTTTSTTTSTSTTTGNTCTQYEYPNDTYLSNCVVPTYLNDGVCDDFCNHPEYNFDKGDCCLDQINDVRCEDCFCFNDCSKHPSKFSESDTYPDCYEPPKGIDDFTCFDHFIGDGFCDAMCNNHWYNFDDGDCCLDYVNTEYCLGHDCICYEECVRKSTVGPNMNQN